MGSHYSIPALAQWYIEGARSYGRSGFIAQNLKPLVSKGSSSSSSSRVVAVTGATKVLLVHVLVLVHSPPEILFALVAT